MSLLAIDDLAIGAGALSLVDGVTLSVEPGEVVALVGESGSGKSLTALSIMGLLTEGLQRQRGHIHFDGVDLTQLSEEQLRSLRGSELAMIFQEPVSSLNPLAAVGAQVAESLIVHGRASEQEANRQAVDMLRRVGIPEPERRARQLPTELSGGMCQRVMIAAALISRPRLLIADEPTTALDVTIQAQILALMSDLAEEANTAVLLITHDMGVVAELADQVCVMYGGRVVEQGPVEALFAAPRHPYTSMLLKTIPRLDEEPKQELFAIRGNVPSPRDWPAGCRFRTRCDRATDSCGERPELQGQLHRVACHHALGGGR
ncbi:ABC transporter ATP-binding protein [Granulosicoccus sp. 3-233]|uniref:ABC transporter ATP-binding protein n=1 Tax=Granulosicoccus sp. 3-233 TaxID=3417969 RepID=UPI003D33A6CF